MDDSSEHSRTRSRGDPVIIACYFLGIVLPVAAMHPIEDPDLWWHLRTGQLIVETRSIPRTDPFSYTASGKPWLNHEWLSQVVFYSVYRTLGFRGLLVLTGILVTLTLFLLFCLMCRRTKGFGLAFLVCVGVVLALRGFQSERPMWFSYLFLSLLLFWIEKSRDKRQLSREMFAVPVLILLWVNLHSGVFLGLSVLMLHWLNAEMKNRISATPLYLCDSLRSLRGITGAAVLASICNPHGIGLAVTAVQHLGGPLPRMTIAEWLPPDLRFPFFLYVLGGTILLLLCLLGSSGRKLRGDELVLLVASTALALTARRHLPLLIFFAAPIIAEQLQIFSHNASSIPAMHSIRGWFSKSRLSQLIHFLIFYGEGEVRHTTLVLVPLFLVFAGYRFHHFTSHHFVEIHHYPERALSFVESRRLPGRIFSVYGWGGYLIYQCWPERKVFMDGRNLTVYPRRTIIEAFTVESAGPGWEKILDRYRVNLIVIPLGLHLRAHLQSHAGWKEVYKDRTAIVFQRAKKTPIVKKNTDRASLSPRRRR